MTYPKLLAAVATILFVTIAALALLKPKSKAVALPLAPSTVRHVPIQLETEVRPARLKKVTADISLPSAGTRLVEAAVVDGVVTQDGDAVAHANDSLPNQVQPSPSRAAPEGKPLLPEADRIAELFNKGEPKLPFVETIVYKSSVAWKKGRPAWLSDYAAYYETSRHFIARSLNGQPDYLRQEVKNGDRFNVFRKDVKLEFHLLVDLHRQKMWLYALDMTKGQRTLLKTYNVGLGRRDKSKLSGFLTPIGKFQLGSKVAIYQPKMEDIHKGKRVEMMRIFGSRWIPFEKELEKCSEPAKGLGLHGVPWIPGADGQLKEDLGCLGRYDSDGCIRLGDADIKEVFAIILSKPTTIEIVKDFYDAKF